MPLRPPPLDPSGKVAPHDHADIAAQDVLLRRISDQHIYLRQDGTKSISSIAFQGSSDGTGMSVDIKKSIEEAGIDPASFITDRKYFCSVQFLAGELRNEGLVVGYMPLANNPHHGAVWGIVTKGQSRRVMRLAIWFVQGEGIALDKAA